jgi:hypothetical protein
MIHEDQVFVGNVVVMDLIWEMVVTSSISRLSNVVAKLNTIVKTCKYRKIHEGHHFIPMAMEVHGPLGHVMDCFIMESIRFFHDRQLKGHLSLFFFIQFFKQCVNIVLYHVLAFAIKRKITLVRNVFLGLLLLLDLTICKQVMIEGLWVK